MVAKSQLQIGAAELYGISLHVRREKLHCRSMESAVGATCRQCSYQIVQLLNHYRLTLPRLSGLLPLDLMPSSEELLGSGPKHEWGPLHAHSFPAKNMASTTAWDTWIEKRRNLGVLHLHRHFPERARHPMTCRKRSHPVNRKHLVACSLKDASDFNTNDANWVCSPKTNPRVAITTCPSKQLV